VFVRNPLPYHGVRSIPDKSFEKGREEVGRRRIESERGDIFLARPEPPSRLLTDCKKNKTFPKGIPRTQASATFIRRGKNNIPIRVYTFPDGKIISLWRKKG